MAPTGGRASYTAPSDVMADLPPNEQVRMREGEGGRERGIVTSKKHYWGQLELYSTVLIMSGRGQCLGARS